MRRLTPLTLFLAVCLAVPALAQTPNPDDTTPCDVSCEDPVLRDLSIDGGEIGFAVSEPATVRIYFDKRSTGRRSQGLRCVKNGSGRRCNLLKRVGKIVVDAPGGRWSQSFEASIDGKPLPAGRYRVLASAVDKDNGLRSNRVSLNYVVRR